MTRATIYTRTDKGEQTAASASRELANDLRKLLDVIDGTSSVDALHSKLNFRDAAWLDRALAALVAKDLIREAESSEGALDFTAPPPTDDSKRKAEEKARREAEEKAKHEADQKARHEAAEKAKHEADQKARREAEERAKHEADQKARHEVAEKAKHEADQKARHEAAEKAKHEAEQKARHEAAEKAKHEAEQKARHEVAEKAKHEADQKARHEVAEKAKHEAEQKARHEAAEKAKHEAEQKAQHEAEEKAKREAEEQELKLAAERVRLKAAESARQDAEEQARKAEEQELKLATERVRSKAAEHARKDAEEHAQKLAEEQALRETAERARLEAEAQARKLAEEHTLREAAERARREAEEKAQRMAEELARRDAEDKTRRDAEEKMRREAEEKARREAEEKVRRDAEEKARREVEEKEKTRREAEDKTRRDAEEKMRREAEEKARREAEDKMRRDVEGKARREVEEKEKTRREAEEKVQREAEETARREAAERPRQEAEAQQRMAGEEKTWREAEEKFRREEQEAAAKRGRRAAAKEVNAGSATPSKRAQQLALGLAALIVIGLIAIHLISFDGQIPQFEKSLAGQFQQPVKIQALRVSLVPQRHVRLEGVSIGSEGQIKILQIKATGALGNLFNDKKAFSLVEVDSPVITEEGLGWLLFGKPSAGGVVFGPVSVLNATLQSKNVSLPAFDAKLQPDGEGGWKTIAIESADKNLTLELTPKGEPVQIDFKARSFRVPFGSNLTLEDLVASGTADRTGLSVTEFKGFAYGGILSGSARLKWGTQWNLSGKLNAKQVDTARLFPGLVDGGRLVGAAAYTMQSPEAAGLFATNRLEGEFIVSRGTLLGVDLGRMLQGGGMGGETRFGELAGAIVHDRGTTQLRQVRLTEATMFANGTADVDVNGNVRGRFAVDLKMSGGQRQANIALAGTLKKIEWRRQ
ncbi:MAG: hypothetical protein NTW45_00515 [Rhodocyclales bacterium]|nr:hypothetical protein [Rhodocyclales bacterium]